MVDAAIPRGKATKRTKTLSNRQAAQTTIARTTGVRQSKEKFRATRIAPTETTTRDGRKVTTYRNLSKRELDRVLKANRHRPVVLLLHGEFGGQGRSGVAGGLGWRHGFSDVDADALLENDVLEKYEHRSGLLGPADRFGAIFR